jgi:hypothetical protein
MTKDGLVEQYNYHLEARNITTNTASFAKVNYEFEYIRGLNFSNKKLLLKLKDATSYSKS